MKILLSSRRTLSRCVIPTCPTATHPAHALLLEDAVGDRIVVKAGFNADHWGQGLEWFSATLALLDWHVVELNEV